MLTISPAGPFSRPIDVVPTLDGQLAIVDFGHFKCSAKAKSRRRAAPENCGRSA
jgi:hypothetical protein